MNRHDISKLIIERLNEIGINYLKKKYEQSGKINHLIIEKVLPNEIATKLSEYFPKEEELNHLNGPQENKYVGVHFTNKQKFPTVKSLDVRIIVQRFPVQQSNMYKR